LLHAPPSLNATSYPLDGTPKTTNRESAAEPAAEPAWSEEGQKLCRARSHGRACHVSAPLTSNKRSAADPIAVHQNPLGSFDRCARGQGNRCQGKSCPMQTCSCRWCKESWERSALSGTFLSPSMLAGTGRPAVSAAAPS
jgi:hypothetical protein